MAEERELAARIAGFAAGALGVADEQVRVEDLRRMAGGASRELWALDLVTDMPPRRLELVLRRDPPTRADESDRGLEFRLLRAAAEAGVPVPRVHWCCSDPAVLGTPFFLMERVAGETIPRRVLRDYPGSRSGLVAELGAILARIHSIDPGQPGLGALAQASAGRGSGLDEVERIAEGLRESAAEPHPVLDLAERWLRERAPEPRRRSVVHGDYRLGNVIVGEEGVRAILDWELSHLGDPVEDLGWMCVRAWRFGADDRPAAGLGSREDLIRGYEEAGGDPVDREALRFWEACGNFKLALVFVTQSRVFLDGLASVELASLGRRIAEPEEELLRFLDGRA
jgi:aminoglycoside phosphotransferase (APT) family kinase protein